MANINADAALKTPRFYYIWFMMFINISCGIAIISAASPMMQEKLNYSPMEAAAIVGLIGVFNGLGRILWSTLSDYLGRGQYLYRLFCISNCCVLLPTQNDNGAEFFCSCYLQ